MTKYERLAQKLTDRDLAFRLLNYGTEEWKRKFCGKPEIAHLYENAFRFEMNRRLKGKPL